MPDLTEVRPLASDAGPSFADALQAAPRDAERLGMGAWTPQALPQGGMGITSFVSALVALTSFALQLVMMIGISMTYQHVADQETPLNAVAGGWTIGTVLVCVAGIIFGIGGILQKNRRRQLAWIGLTANTIFCFLLLAMIMCGMMAVDPQTGHSYVSAMPPADPIAWSAPHSRLLRWATLVIAILLVRVHLRKRRDARKWPLAATSPVRKSAPSSQIVCVRCTKPLPADARFCRRCGQRAGRAAALV